MCVAGRTRVRVSVCVSMNERQSWKTENRVLMPALPIRIRIIFLYSTMEFGKQLKNAFNARINKNLLLPPTSNVEEMEMEMKIHLEMSFWFDGKYLTMVKMSKTTLMTYHRLSYVVIHVEDTKNEMKIETDTEA